MAEGAATGGAGGGGGKGGGGHGGKDGWPGKGKRRKRGGKKARELRQRLEAQRRQEETHLRVQEEIVEGVAARVVAESLLEARAGPTGQLGHPGLPGAIAHVRSVLGLPYRTFAAPAGSSGSGTEPAAANLSAHTTGQGAGGRGRGRGGYRVGRGRSARRCHGGHGGAEEEATPREPKDEEEPPSA
jgi:hypothetical protein